MLAVLASLVGFVVAPRGAGDDTFAGVLTGAAVVGALVCVVLARHRPRFVPLLAAVSFLGVAGPVLYLHSLPEDSAAIPIGEVGGMFLSLVVMATTFFLLPTGEREPHATPRLTHEGR